MHFELHSTKSTIIRTIIFTFGHYWIDVSCNHFVTGAPLRLAMISGIVGPTINAIWYFVLDRVFFSYVLAKMKTKKSK